jgi:hypothetical protein
MAKRCLGVLSLFLVLAVLAQAQEAEQPLKKAKVGDYVIFKLSSDVAKMSMRQEVTAVTEKEVTIRSTTTVNGMELKATEQTIDISNKADPAVEARNRKDKKIVDTGKGQETLKINGKDYRCEWRSNTTTVTAGGKEITSESKVWTSKDAPVYGLVKTESKVFGQVTVMELTEAGSKK